MQVADMETENMVFDDQMGASRVKFKLTYSSLWHLAKGGTRLIFRPSIVIPRLILWLDVSKWQGFINFLVMKRAGPHGLIMKCGQGSAKDPQFDRNRVESKKAGIPRGTYWFYDSRIPPKLQASYWWEWIKEDTWELMHFADYEEAYGGSWGGWQNFKIFLQEFQRLSGLPSSKIGIYTAYYYWIAHSPTNTADLNWFAQFTLWLAWYTANPANVLIPRPWSILVLIAWQFGTPVEGEKYGTESLEIDESNVNTENEETYEKLFRLGDTQPDNGGTMTELYGEAKGSITMRIGPGTNYGVAALNGETQYVLNGDKVWATEDLNGFWKLRKIVRSNAEIPLPPVAWCGTAFITKLPLPVEVATITVDVLLHDVKVSGDLYAARGVVAKKEV